MQKSFSLELYGCWRSTQVKVCGAWLYLCLCGLCVSRPTWFSIHGCHTNIAKHIPTNTTQSTVLLCGASCPPTPGVLLSCQKRMDEEAALHSKGLWGNTTNMTHTHPHVHTPAHTHSLWMHMHYAERRNELKSSDIYWYIGQTQMY